jgi:hypothetical protein
MSHSTIVGGSTASRVINCPGSVKLVAQMPPRPSSSYADEGTLLHEVMAELLNNGLTKPEDFIGRRYENVELTQDLIEDKVRPAMRLLDEVDPEQMMDVLVERKVGFGDLLPGVFGSCDVIGRLGDTAYIIDWKFGDGVAVSAEENKQLMFYCAAAMRTDGCEWVFKGAKEVELVIIQPPVIRRWKTTFERIKEFELDLVRAVKAAQEPDAPLSHGDHCRWCAAKPICPRMTGEVDRALKTQLQNINVDAIGGLLNNADLLEGWIKDLRALAFELLESDVKVPGYKLVAKRATRQWTDDKGAVTFLKDNGVEPFEPKLKTPAAAEKELKKSKVALPSDLIVAVSSGSTLAPEDDPRPAVLNIGKQLTAALSKLQ